jgi:thymidine kinase
MAKLHLIYSVMNSGKTASLLITRDNYEKNGGRVLVFTSAVDDRYGVGKVRSRVGLEAPAYALTPQDNLYSIVEREHNRDPVVAVLLDEINFMTPAHARQASDIAEYLDIAVMAYGLRNNSQGTLFGEGVQTFLALAQDIKESKTTCHCHKRKATMILRYGKNGRVIRDGEVIQTGAEESYVSVCSGHYKSGDIGPLARQMVEKRGEELHVFCRCCEQSYGPVGMDWNQALDCAADVRGNEVLGHYGSDFDLSIFRFVNGRPETVPNGLICDKCIRDLVESGVLVYQGERELGFPKLTATL